MTDREAMQQALEALESRGASRELHHHVITALRERLAHCDRCGKRLGGPDHIHTCSPQQPVQEPWPDEPPGHIAGGVQEPVKTVSVDEYKRLQELVTSQGIRLMEYESAQPVQEPRAWLSWNDKDGYGYWDTKAEADLNCAGDTEPEPLYTAPQPDTKANSAETAKQISEPVTWVERWYGSGAEQGWWIVCGRDHIVHLGTDVQGDGDTVRKIVDAHNSCITPQPRQWQGLTDEDIEFIYADTGYNEIGMFARAIEQALREKNGGGV